MKYVEGKTRAIVVTRYQICDDCFEVGDIVRLVKNDGSSAKKWVNETRVGNPRFIFNSDLQVITDADEAPAKPNRFLRETRKREVVLPDAIPLRTGAVLRLKARYAKLTMTSERGWDCIEPSFMDAAAWLELSEICAEIGQALKMREEGKAS
jgi:hypothetical protein